MSHHVYLVRHGQGEHNVEPTVQNRKIHDPALTDLGVRRCKDFNKTFPEYIHIDLVCASPMRRAIQTAKYCFEDVIARTPCRQILLLPLAQETTNEPCDVGSSSDAIKEEFGDLVDVSMLGKDWATKEGTYAASPEGVIARGREFRQWLRQQQDKNVIVVGHGAFWDYLFGADANDVLSPGYKSSWTNRQWRVCAFPKAESDGPMVEEKESIMRRNVLDDGK
ncbi:hypothetical protein LTR78_010173 [Recurvomyces mirabilis]|uniref:Phosphoglycerate mutase-like protein n=1 Tax=Recurvomyces mirabilis TaxID=574656 RepID=A0AAE0WH09_9PEZI|nr:hypothetical protein LTR78_010173 [Recurvomyces mirabilis]KAK5149702.1 hypothetical protein LTS14_010700 [Recurvomyces mirabilis]